MHTSQRGFLSTSGLIAVLMTVLFVFALFFGVWAFMGRQDYKNNVDEKVAEASAVAVKEAEAQKDAEFAELEKNPNRVYAGPSTYGSITYSYPKTWSLYQEQDKGAQALNLYGFPIVIPGLDSKTPMALRLEVVNKSFDSVLEGYNKNLQNGSLVAQAYRPPLVPSVLGTRLDGELAKDIQGAMVILPLRDKTILLYTESPQYIGDFNQLLTTLTFVP